MSHSVIESHQINDFLRINDGKWEIIIPKHPKYSYTINHMNVYSESPLTNQEIADIKNSLNTYSRYKGFYAVILVSNQNRDLGLTDPHKFRVYVEKGPIFNLTLHHEFAHILFNLLPKKERLLITHWYFELLSIDDNKKEGGIWRVIDESWVFGLDNRIGHPYDNASEMFASALTSLYFRPNYVEKTISNLDMEAQEIWKNTLYTIKEIASPVLNQQQRE